MQQGGLSCPVGTGHHHSPTGVQPERDGREPARHGEPVGFDHSFAGTGTSTGTGSGGEAAVEPERPRGPRHPVLGEPVQPLAGVADPAHRTVCARAGPEGAGPAERVRRLARDLREPSGVVVGDPLHAADLLPPLLVLPLPAGAGGGPRGQMAGVAVAVAVDGVPVVVHLQNRGRDAVQEEPVVGDGDERAAVGEEVLLQPCDGLVVQVVGRFVEQQQFGLGGEGRREGEPGALPAGERAERAVRIERGTLAEPVQGGGDPTFGVPAAARLVAGQQPVVRGQLVGAGQVQPGLGGSDPALQVAEFGERAVDRVSDARGGGQVEGLREVRGAAGHADGDLPVVGTFEAGHQPQQGGLAGAVVTDDADPFAGPDRTVDAVQHDVGVEALADLGQDDLGCGEWCAQAGSFHWTTVLSSGRDET